MSVPDSAMQAASDRAQRRLNASDEPTEEGLDDAVMERDELLTLLRIAQAAATLDLDALIEQVGNCFQRDHWRWDYVGLFVFDPVAHVLRQHCMYAVPGLTPNPRDFVRTLPVDDSLSGTAMRTRRPVVANSREECLSQLSARWVSMIPPEFSCCVTPLICREKLGGTVCTASWRSGAFDAAAVRFLSQVAHSLAPAVDNALAYREIGDLRDRISKQKRYLEGEIESGLGEMIGSSARMGDLQSLIRSVATTDSSVLIQGETGTGKELVARAVHQLSGRREATFVKINCAAIPAGLIESELFGHERGAFTGAVGQKIGRFELADGGTLFLDEVGELPLELQPKLLRVLQEQEFERLGGTETIKVDVRIIAATNRDLRGMVADRTFRSDLFYRLSVFPIAVPPLRDRPQDIADLVSHFVRRCARRTQKDISIVPAETLAALARYDWPGNVRELENVVERSVILSAGPELVVAPGALEASRPPPAPERGPRTDPGEAAALPTLAVAERAFVLSALEETNWVVGGRAGAAARLGLSRTTLQARMRKLGISRPGSRAHDR